ncbi:MAG: M48 family metallopeptidase [Gammaproteobacteria bacterium]|nr:M48 family metallopeptidase [Gammaproteobacteria bacterium]
MLNDIDIEVVQKEIKNIHLSVYPPNGQVKVSAPNNMDLDTLRVFVISKLSWIKQQQAKLRTQKRELARDYIDRESHYFNGKRYLLRVIEKNEAPQVNLDHNEILLQVRPNTEHAKRQSLIDEWYRTQLRQMLSPLIIKWEKKIKVSVSKWTIRKMKTKWGSCSPDSQSIRINLDLAKKPSECLEYIVLHEMVHLLEPSHNTRFITLMDKFMPKWRFYRDELNALPVRHENWKY